MAGSHATPGVQNVALQRSRHILSAQTRRLAQGAAALRTRRWARIQGTPSHTPSIGKRRGMRRTNARCTCTCSRSCRAAGRGRGRGRGRGHRVRGAQLLQGHARNLAHLIQLCVIGLRSRIDVCGVTRKRQRSIVRNLITTTVGRLEQARVHRPPAQPTMSQKVNPDTGLHTASSAR